MTPTEVFGMISATTAIVAQLPIELASAAVRFINETPDEFHFFHWWEKWGTVALGPKPLKMSDYDITSVKGLPLELEHGFDVFFFGTRTNEIGDNDIENLVVVRIYIPNLFNYVTEVKKNVMSIGYGKKKQGVLEQINKHNIAENLDQFDFIEQEVVLDKVSDKLVMVETDIGSVSMVGTTARSKGTFTVTLKPPKNNIDPKDEIIEKQLKRIAELDAELEKKDAELKKKDAELEKMET